MPDTLRTQLVSEARAAFPRECCGLIEGTVKNGAAHATLLHPTRNVSTRPDRFEIDPAQHIALLRKLRDTERNIVGCYHSHPNGNAEPSTHDLASATEEKFVWLIAALESAADKPRLAAFVSTGSSFEPMRIEELP